MILYTAVWQKMLNETSQLPFKGLGHSKNQESRRFLDDDHKKSKQSINITFCVLVHYMMNYKKSI